MRPGYLSFNENIFRLFLWDLNLHCLLICCNCRILLFTWSCIFLDHFNEALEGCIRWSSSSSVGADWVAVTRLEEGQLARTLTTFSSITFNRSSNLCNCCKIKSLVSGGSLTSDTVFPLSLSNHSCILSL